VFASPSVGAGFSTTGAAPLAPPPGASGAPGFFEQLQRATARAGESDSAAETPAPTPIVINGPSKNVPALVPSSMPVAIAKPAKWPGNADSSDELSSSDPDIPGSSVKPTQPAVSALTGPVTPGSVPVAPRGSRHRASPDNGSGTVAELNTPASGLPSNQNPDLRSLIPPQAPASGSPSVLASEPSTVLLTMDSSATSTSPIQTYAASNPIVGQLAFAARIKPEGAAVPPQSLPASGANSIAHDVPASQTVKSTSEASAKDADSDRDQPENSAPPASGNMSTAAKSSPRKDEADSTANPVEPDAAPLLQLITQSVSTRVPDEPGAGVQANAAPAAQSTAAPEPTHALLDRPAPTTSAARNISLQVEAASGQTVDIRMAARSGDLDVAVRSGDAAVTQDLRQGLGDLESRLAQSGYHAETWHPGHNGSTTEPAAASGNSSNSQSQQQSQSGSGWSRQNRGQGDNNPSNRPRWVNQLASTLKAESTEKGNANGIVT
jgi:hypothetical protein